MSDYSPEKRKCTCDTPHGSEYRRCDYCKDIREKLFEKKSAKIRRNQKKKK